MRTIAWEVASQIALRNCSEELGVGGEESIYCDLGEGGDVQSSTHVGRGLLLVIGTDVSIKDFSAFLDMRRCKKLGS